MPINIHLNHKEQEVRMRFLTAIIIFMAFSASSMSARQIEKKGSFGVVIQANFVKFNYVITYLGDSYKENHHAFRLDFEDNKGYDITSAIEEEKTHLKTRKNKTIQGKVERQSIRSAILLFPKDNDEPLKGKTTLYTVILGYKLKKSIRI